jgi:peptidoglycan/LPS O-acetylase OafA/YrhL
MTGLIMFILSVLHSPDLRRILSVRYFTFLGSISFGIYLLHPMLMGRTLMWVVYGPITAIEYRTCVFSITVVPWFALLLYLCRLWRDYVDGFCIRVTKYMETRMSRPTGDTMGESTMHKSGTDIEAGQRKMSE